MSKRVAEKELTDRNWQDEDEPEEAGVFVKASEDVIKQRVIKSAKRRAPATNNGDSKASLFSGFTGFTPTQNLNIQPSLSFPKINDTNGDTKPLFTFGAKTSEPQQTQQTDPPQQTVPDNSDTTKISDKSAASKSEVESSSNNDAFLKKLKKLNQSVIKFAKEHVDKNPFVILTNVFSDYEKHLKKLQEGQSAAESTAPSSNESSTPSSKELSSDSPSKGDPKEESPTKVGSSSKEEVKQSPNSTESNPFTAATSTATPAFSFGATAPKWSFGTGSTGFSFKPTTSAADSTQPATGGFSFKPSSTAAAPGTSLFGKPIGSTSFTGFGGLVGKPADSTEKKEEETEEETEEDETPPKAEKVDHIDKAALYHIKCKLFLKSGDSWNEKGLGIANLKECNGKVQLLVRNDTTMGTVVLNTLLQESTPVSRSGKNGVMIVAINEESVAETYLCRVNKDKVEEFYDKLTEYKKGAPPTTSTD